MDTEAQIQIRHARNRADFVALYADAGRLGRFVLRMLVCWALIPWGLAAALAAALRSLLPALWRVAGDALVGALNAAQSWARLVRLLDAVDRNDDDSR